MKTLDMILYLLEAYKMYGNVPVVAYEDNCPVAPYFFDEINNILYVHSNYQEEN